MPDQSLPLRKIKERQEPPSDQFLRMPIGKAIFTLAWPATLTVLLENLATTVDMIMVGRLGAAEVAAVGFSSMIYWLLSSLLIGIEAAATAIVARKIGANKVGEANTALAQCLVLAFVPENYKVCQSNIRGYPRLSRASRRVGKTRHYRLLIIVSMS